MSLFITLSPAKRFTCIEPPEPVQTTTPFFSQQASVLATMMGTLTKDELRSLMHVSEDIASLNYARYQSFHLEKASSYLPAVYGFAGDAYKALDVRTLDFYSLQRMQHQLGILSGLYGLLRPFDKILPYRLEMGTATEQVIDCNLYTYWQDILTERLQACISKANAEYHINLASDEYGKAIRQERLSVPTVTLVFAKAHKDSYKVTGIVAKRMRGHMTRCIVEQDIKDLDGLRSVVLPNFTYSTEHSSMHKLVYLAND